MITIVSGFQRCGTSLLMQMLHAGGLRCFHDPGMGYPAFEHMRMLEADTTWLTELDGQAVKWLDPLRWMPPPALPHEARIIWMTRNHDEQGKSAMKFLRATLNSGGLDLNLSARDAARKMAESYRRDEPRALKAWGSRGFVRIVAFEDLLLNPLGESRTVAAFLDRDLNVTAMARQVVAREPECLPYLLETELRRSPRT